MTRKAIKSYIHIRDVSRGEVGVLEKGRIGEIYHLSPDCGISVRDIVAKICEKMKVDFPKMVKNVEERLGQDSAYVIDSGKAKKEFGWKPMVNIDDGLGEVIKWIEANWAEICRQPLEYVHKA